jgi:hypothetical protein
MYWWLLAEICECIRVFCLESETVSVSHVSCANTNKLTHFEHSSHRALATTFSGYAEATFRNDKKFYDFFPYLNMLEKFEFMQEKETRMTFAVFFASPSFYCCRINYKSEKELN